MSTRDMAFLFCDSIGFYGFEHVLINFREPFFYVYRNKSLGIYPAVMGFPRMEGGSFRVFVECVVERQP